MRFSAVVFFSAVLAFGQAQPDSRPVQAKRVPADKPPPVRGQSLIDLYDYGAQVSALEDETKLRPGVPAVRPVTANGGKEEGPRSIVPLDFVPKTDVYLTETAREAVAMSAKWMAEPNPPSTGRDGRVLYAFGAGLPSVVCAPLRVCMIELQAGEKLVGDPNSVLRNQRSCCLGTSRLPVRNCDIGVLATTRQSGRVTVTRRIG